MPQTAHHHTEPEMPYGGLRVEEVPRARHLPPEMLQPLNVPDNSEIPLGEMAPMSEETYRRIVGVQGATHPPVAAFDAAL
jgi:hypothetical protein